jgi:hypothetical protein
LGNISSLYVGLWYQTSSQDSRFLIGGVHNASNDQPHGFEAKAAPPLGTINGFALSAKQGAAEDVTLTCTGIQMMRQGA